MHPDEPVVDVLLAGHAMQLDVPVVLANVPAVQATQRDCCPFPAVGFAVPTGQAVHEVGPLPKNPALHTQALDAVDPAGDVVPAAHGVHRAASNVSENVPAGQVVQPVVPVPKVPGGHKARRNSIKTDPCPLDEATVLDGFVPPFKLEPPPP